MTTPFNLTAERFKRRFKAAISKLRSGAEASGRSAASEAANIADVMRRIRANYPVRPAVKRPTLTVVK